MALIDVVKYEAVIDECERVANCLLQNAKYVSHKNKLNTIYDRIKYSDHVSDYKSSEILSVLNDISMPFLLCSDIIQNFYIHSPITTPAPDSSSIHLPTTTPTIIVPFRLVKISGVSSYERYILNKPYDQPENF